MKKFKDKVIVILLAGFMFGMSILGIITPDSEYSLSERRKLAKFPQISIKNVLSGKFMTDFEEYTTDHFPLRDMFRKIKAVSEINVLGKKDNNGLYEYEGYLAEMQYPLDTDSIRKATDKFTAIYENYLTSGEGRVFLSVVPDKNYFLADISGHLSLDYEKLAALTKEGMPFAEYIDIFPYLSVEDYYLTDTHWKQENIIDVASAIKKAMGAESSSEYVVTANDDVPFYGVYASQYALNKQSDTISYVTSSAIDSMVVFDHENQKAIPVYDTAKLTSSDPYELFLGGPISLVTIENPSAENDRKLIIFRDSFASSLAPLVAEGYSKVTLIDIRYIAPNVLSNFVEFDGADVLFIYSSMVLNNSSTLK